MKAPRPLVGLQLFARSSRVQRKRAFLTIAAIAWGALALLLLLSFGEGLKRQMAKGRAGMGTDLAIMWPGETSVPYRGLPEGRPVRPRIEDVALVRERVAGLDGVLGELRNWQVSFTYAGKTINGRVTGTSPNYGELRNHIPRPGGRFLNALDLKLRRRVIFLGNEVAEEIFGEREPVGETLLLNRVPYTVVGVMKKKMQMGTYGGPDASNAVIPASTYEAQFGTDRLEVLVVRPERPELMDAVLERVHEVLGAKYRFDPGDEEVFGVWDTVETSKVIRNMSIGIQLFLGIIGALTLMIGGVGVANIMYAVVKERTREIGVMMALGARRGWIIGSLLLEGAVFTLAGGAIGTGMAVAVIWAAGLLPIDQNEALQFLGKPTLSLPIAVSISALLGGIGILAGYFPARRAASIDPAQTLRYE
jgi:putative ABC transport system permease protein